jgi:hypothetical protein
VAATRTLLFTLLLLLLLETSGFTESSVEIMTNVLFQEGFGGKQVYDGSGDQHLELYEPMVFIDAQLGETTNIHLEAVYDSFTTASGKIFDARSGASRRAAGRMFDAATGASGTPTPVPTPGPTPGPGTPGPTPVPGTPGPTPTPGPGGTQAAEALKPLPDVWEKRESVDIGITQKLGTWTISPSGGYSTESDYISRHGGLSLSKSFAEDNFTVSAGAFYYQDSALPFDLASGRFTDWTLRLTRSASLTASQILGPADLVLVGAGWTRQTGYLVNSRNTVIVPQGRTQEVLPDDRSKWTGTFRYIHGFSPVLSLHFDYRYYTDDWGVAADTFEPSLVVGSEDEADLFRLVYRYYVQQGTRYYGVGFPGEGGYMTSDSDLMDFQAREFRLHYSHRWELPQGLPGLALGGALIYYVRNNDLRAWIYQVGVSGEF